ncbi:MAG: CPBP family intramembrane metalloprotease [Chloroflexota bacterium]|nr:CPBP family intramembrane metalloprotease [Chloroflexota bacterium]
MNALLAPNNHLIALARQGKRLPHLVLLLIVSIIATFVMQILGIIPALLVLQLLGAGDNSALASAARGAILLIGSTSLIFAFIWAWLRWFDQRPYWTLGLEPRGALGKYARGLLVGLLMFAAAVGLAAAFGYVAYEQGDPQQQGLAALGGVLLITLGWIVQGASEEVLCRGWLLPSIGGRYRPWLGVFISALVFALLHSLNPGLSVLAMVNLFLFGIFAALYALYEGGLWGIFALHSVWNWAQGNLFGFEVSGTTPEGGSLLNLQETGPDLITGGRFGPEGGLVVSAVLLGGILVLVALARRMSRSPVPAES